MRKDFNRITNAHHLIAMLPVAIIQAELLCKIMPFLNG